MKQISRRLASIRPSQTMAVTQRARELRAAGRDIISLSVGESDFDTPDFICEAAVEAMAQGKTRYTNVDGTGELKAAIAAKFSRDNQLDYEPDEISAAPGGKAVIFNALMATLDIGDEVVIPAPCWVSYPEMARLAGGRPVIVKTSAKTGYKLTPSVLEQALSAKTRWLLLNSPSNPTGAAYSAKELSALADVLRGHPDVLILCDDIYEHLLYDGHSFATMAAIAPDLKARVLTMNGVSKCYAMTGWRIGYGAGPKWLIAAMAKVMSQTTSNPCSVSQAAAAAVLSGDQSFLSDWRQIFQMRRNLVMKHIDAIDGLTAVGPAGAFYVFMNCEGLLGRQIARQRLESDIDIATALLDEVGVALVPGTAFHAPGHLRLSFALDQASLNEACARIAEFCNRLY